MALQAIGLGANWVPPQCSPAGGVQPQAHPCPQLCWGVAPSPAAHLSLFSASKGCGGRGGRWGGQGVAPPWRADSEQSRIYYPETRAWSGVGGREGSILWARIPPWAEAGGTGFRLLSKGIILQIWQPPQSDSKSNDFKLAFRFPSSAYNMYDPLKSRGGAGRTPQGQPWEFLI